MSGWSGYNNSNPYANPYSNTNNNNNNKQAGPSYPTNNNNSYSNPNAPYDPYGGQETSFDANVAEQSSIYTPAAAASKGGYTVASTSASTSGTTLDGKARKTVMRKAGGTLWEDASLMEWDPTHFRLFIGDLDPALSDDIFQTAFSGSKYPSFVKAKIIRDKYTNKGKGFGFVSYSDPEDFLKAWKDLNGKYVGTRPVKISKATTGVGAVEIGNKKAREMDLRKKAKSGTKPYERAKLAELESGGPNNGRSGKNGGFGPEKDRKSYIRR